MATSNKPIPATPDALAPNAHVAGQYEKWVYPAPIMDLNAPEHKARRDGGDYERNWYTFWPNESPREDLDVLVAGCGSNAAARYAFNHPKARVTGLDLSSSSLAHEQYLKDKHKLENLDLHQGRLEDVAAQRPGGQRRVHEPLAAEQRTEDLGWQPEH